MSGFNRTVSSRVSVSETIAPQASGYERTSDIRLGSAEKLAESGATDAERWKRGRRRLLESFALDVLVVDLTDPTLTPSQHNRARQLGQELVQLFGGK